MSHFKFSNKNNFKYRRTTANMTRFSCLVSISLCHCALLLCCACYQSINQTNNKQQLFKPLQAPRRKVATPRMIWSMCRRPRPPRREDGVNTALDRVSFTEDTHDPILWVADLLTVLLSPLVSSPLLSSPLLWWLNVRSFSNISIESCFK